MAETHLKVTVYSHHFTVIPMTPKGRLICMQLCNRLIQWGQVPGPHGVKNAPIKVFAATTEDRSIYRFHINSYKTFTEIMTVNNMNDSNLEKIIEPMYPTDDVKLPIKYGWDLRDYQIPVVEYLLKPEPKSKLVTLATGTGKGLSSITALSQIGKRTIIVVRPMYIEKWQIEILDILDIRPDDLLVVKGGNQLMAFIAAAKAGMVKEKIILISNKTYQIWLKNYEKFKDDSLDLGYDCLPHEMYKYAKAGVRLIDEAHLDVHLTFKQDLYTHVDKSISLTATLMTYDPFITGIHKTMHPISTRYVAPPLDKHIDAFAVHFSFNNAEKIRVCEYGRDTFSMNAVETSVMRHVPTLRNYLNLIDYMMQIGFFKCTRKEKKLIIFAYSKEMIDLIVDFIKKKYPQFNTQRYVAEDDYDKLINCDIAVSTIGSAGTAVDLPNLTNTIMTNQISSLQANIQVLGRLRKLKDGYQTQFHYTVMDNIEKSVAYHDQKKLIFAERAKSFRDIYSGHVV